LQTGAFQLPFYHHNWPKKRHMIHMAEMRPDRDVPIGSIIAPNADYIMVWRNRGQWGEARFLAEAKVTPQPAHIRNGQSLPISMVDGLPQVDWTQLK
jgi:hypothetical protein